MSNSRNKFPIQYSIQINTEGLDPREGFSELPNHLGVKLKFMAFLCHKTTEALEKGDQNGAVAFHFKQWDLPREHLLSWSCKFLGNMEEKASIPLYYAI